MLAGPIEARNCIVEHLVDDGCGLIRFQQNRMRCRRAQGKTMSKPKLEILKAKTPCSDAEPDNGRLAHFRQMSRLRYRKTQDPMGIGQHKIGHFAIRFSQIGPGCSDHLDNVFKREARWRGQIFLVQGGYNPESPTFLNSSVFGRRTPAQCDHLPLTHKRINSHVS